MIKMRAKTINSIPTFDELYSSAPQELRTILTNVMIHHRAPIGTQRDA